MPKPLLFFLSTTALPEKMPTVLVAGMATGNSFQCTQSVLTACPQEMVKAHTFPEWVVLVEQMVLALIIHEPVGIVHPVLCGREMELRPIRLLIGRDALSNGTLGDRPGTIQWLQKPKDRPSSAASLSSFER